MKNIEEAKFFSKSIDYQELKDKLKQHEDHLKYIPESEELKRIEKALTL